MEKREYENLEKALFENIDPEAMPKMAKAAKAVLAKVVDEDLEAGEVIDMIIDGEFDDLPEFQKPGVKESFIARIS